MGDAVQTKKKAGIGPKHKIMKDWNVNASKFYGQMMNTLAAFFGMDAAETTEAELHQKLVDAGTVEQIETEAAEKVGAKMTAFEEQVGGLQAQFEALQSQFDTLKTESEERAQKIVALNTDIEQLRADITEREGTIAAHKATIASLSGELATMKAGRALDLDSPADESIPLKKEAAAPKAGVMTQAQVLEYFN